MAVNPTSEVGETRGRYAVMSDRHPTRPVGAGSRRKPAGSAGWNETTVGSPPGSASASVTSKTKRRAPAGAPASAIVPTAPPATRTSQTLPGTPAPSAFSRHRYTREAFAWAPSPSGLSATRRGSGPRSMPSPPAIRPRHPPHWTAPPAAPPPPPAALDGPPVGTAAQDGAGGRGDRQAGVAVVEVRDVAHLAAREAARPAVGVVEAERAGGPGETRRVRVALAAREPHLPQAVDVRQIER